MKVLRSNISRGDRIGFLQAVIRSDAVASVIEQVDDFVAVHSRSRSKSLRQCEYSPA